MKQVQKDYDYKNKTSSPLLVATIKKISTRTSNKKRKDRSSSKSRATDNLKLIMLKQQATSRKVSTKQESRQNSPPLQRTQTKGRHQRKDSSPEKNKIAAIRLRTQNNSSTYTQTFQTTCSLAGNSQAYENRTVIRCSKQGGSRSDNHDALMKQTLLMNTLCAVNDVSGMDSTAQDTMTGCGQETKAPISSVSNSLS